LKTTALFGLPCFLILPLILGCATYEPTNKLASLSNNPELKQVQITDRGLELRASVFKDPQVAKSYVGIDPVKSEMMPVLLRVRNTNDHPIRVDLTRSLLLSGSGEAFSSLSTDQSIEKARISDAEVVGWTVGFGLIGALISGSRTAAANRSLDEDYQRKSFKPAVIMSKGIGEGLVFFGVPADKQESVSSIVLHTSDLDRKEFKSIALPLE
jgi:hypothetical protein